jgi:hypothetical protein
MCICCSYTKQTRGFIIIQTHPHRDTLPIWGPRLEAYIYKAKQWIDQEDFFVQVVYYMDGAAGHTNKIMLKKEA